jgi:hypothetical protein
MMKKAVSYFMPERGAHYIFRRGGNPTKHHLVNEVIAEVHRCEVRREGAPSQVKHPVTESEFKKTIDLFKDKPRGGFNEKIKYPTMLKWQYHLITRIDDVCHFKTSDPHGHPEFPFALATKVRWSKNVLEERRCPDQIIFGSMDPENCMQLGMALYLEQYLDRFPDADYLFTEASDTVVQDDDGNDKRIYAGDRLIDQFCCRLEDDVWAQAVFKELAPPHEELGVGSHSYWKYMADCARKAGNSAESVEIRGCWKSQGSRVVFRYIDVRQLYDDAKVAASNCWGGAIAYKLKQGFGYVNDDFLMTHVIPNIARRYGNDRRMIHVLGNAVLWACLEESMEDEIPLALKQRVVTAYLPLAVAAEQDAQVNPIAKVPLTVYRIQDTLKVDLVENQGQGPGQAPQGAGGNDVPIQFQGQQEQINGILIQLGQLQQQQAVMQQQLEHAIYEQRRWHERQYQVVNSNIRRFGGTIQGGFARQDQRQAANRRQAQQEEELPADGPGSATLSKTPRTLMELWNEWQFGINGRKPAKDWTARERGNTTGGIKQKYYRRKAVWEILARLVNQGYSPQGACHRIRQCYGRNQSVTGIICGMLRDRRAYAGCHPNLR